MNTYFLDIVAPITYRYKNLSARPGVIEPTISKNKHSMLIINYIYFALYWYEIFLQCRFNLKPLYTLFGRDMNNRMNSHKTCYSERFRRYKYSARNIAGETLFFK